MKRSFKQIAISTGVLTLVTMVLLIGLYAHVVSFGMAADSGDADVILVLGAAVWPDGPSPALQARVLQGVRLYHEGRANYLLLAGGLGAYPPTEAEAMAVLAGSLDVASEQMILEEKSANTRENMYYASKIMQENGWTRALIVTDDFHMKRAVIIAKDMGIETLRAPVNREQAYYGRSERIRYTAREGIGILHYYLTRWF